MNRIFHVQITKGTWLLLALLTAVLLVAFWQVLGLMALALAIGMVVLIERIIHSTYTLTTDGHLVVYYGRFSKGKDLLLSDIADVQLLQGHGFAGLLPSTYVRVQLTDGTGLSLVPLKPEEFVRALVKRLEQYREEEGFSEEDESEYE